MIKKTSLVFIGINLVSLILFIVISMNVLNGNLNEWNSTVYDQMALLINPSLTSFMIFIDFIGKWYVYLPIALLFLSIPKSRKKIGVPLTFSLLFGGVLNFILKQIYAIPRPDVYRLVIASGYGHPSGHVMYGAAFIGICVLLVLKYTSKKALKVSVIVISTAFMLLMGFNRIYVGAHTATDVVTGYLAGTCVIISSAFILNKFGLLKHV